MRTGAIGETLTVKPTLIALIVPSTALIDRFGRHIEYLRLSVTDRCDLRCVYCIPEGFKDFEEPGHWLTFDELERLLGLFAELGLRRVRFTGGEPLLRRNVADLARRVAAIPPTGVMFNRRVLNGALDAQGWHTHKHYALALNALTNSRMGTAASADGRPFRDLMRAGWQDYKTARDAPFQPPWLSGDD